MALDLGNGMKGLLVLSTLTSLTACVNHPGGIVYGGSEPFVPGPLTLERKVDFVFWRNGAFSFPGSQVPIRDPDGARQYFVPTSEFLKKFQGPAIFTNGIKKQSWGDSMKVIEAVEDVDNLIGKVVEIEGVFALSDDIAQFVILEEPGEEHFRGIEISVDHLRSTLIGIVPPFGGSKFWYFHRAMARGVFEKVTDGKSAGKLTQVESLVFYESGVLYPVIQNGKLFSN